MQIKQRIFKCTDIQVYNFFSKHDSENFYILHTFFPLTVAKLSTLKKVRFFAHHVHD